MSGAPILRQQHPAHSARPVARGYRPASSVDEMLSPDGNVRPHWRTLLEDFDALGPQGRAQAREATERHLHENGITFNVFADPEDRAHAWRLDLLPMIMSEAEWRTLERGIAQRAALAELVLRDLYGERTVLRERLLPPSAILGSPDFVRAQVRRDGISRRFLYFYACDVARDRDGAWTVLADQTDTPSGNGWVLAGRMALSHGLSDLFTKARTRRLSPYYQTVQAYLAELELQRNGRAVVLTDRPDEVGYFSHAYLARYLGFAACEPEDLTVRDNALMLKTLDGLQPVALLLRKIDSGLCDPLFLPNQELQGIAGLMQVVRQERVTLANAPGTGLVHNRMLALAEEALCRRFLGEDLRLSSPHTVWLGCGEDRARAARDDLVHFPLTARNEPGRQMREVRPNALDAAQRARFEQVLSDEGHLWAASAPTGLASVPSYADGRMESRTVAMRCYAAFDGTRWTVMPGALVRLAGEPSAVSLPNGHGSKDLWVVGGEVVGGEVVGGEAADASVSLVATARSRVHLRRTGRDLLSRTADNLFWLGRNAERAECLLRMARSIVARLSEDGSIEVSTAALARLARTMLGASDTLSRRLGARPDLAMAVHQLLTDASPPFLPATLADLNRTATQARDQISHDAWRILHSLHVDPRWRHIGHRVADPATLELLDEGIRTLHAFAGTGAENMTRNWAWRFLEIGRRIERGAQLVALTRSLVLHTEEPESDGSLRLLLEVGDSAMTYRSRYLMAPIMAPVIDLMILDESNPRSLGFQIAELEAHLGAFPRAQSHASQEQRLALELTSLLRLADIEQLRHADGAHAALAPMLDRTAVLLSALSDQLVTSHFAHSETQVSTVARSGDARP